MSDSVFGSSERVISRQSPSAAVINKLDALSIDEPLPAIPAADRVRLLIQSPRRIYAYWNFARDPYAPLRKAFGSRADSYAVVVRLIDTTTKSESFFEASPGRSQWLDVSPGHAYRVEVGLSSPGRPFIRILSSEAVQIPRAAVAPDAPQPAGWRIPAPDFARVLARSGYTQDALAVAFEATDRATQLAAIRSIAEGVGETDLPRLDDDSLAEIRRAFAAIVGGSSGIQLEYPASADARRWFDALLLKQFGDAERARLIELIKACFGVEIGEYELGLGFEVDSLVLSASGQNVRSHPIRFWMPSLTPGWKSWRG